MKYYSSFISDLEKLISFKSTLDKAESDAPFGRAVKDALDYFLSVAEGLGFETVNYDNYGGEVSFGEGEEIGIIGHLDVVPTGIGWNTDPFVLTKSNGVYFARGILDDKAPLLSCLYALYELKESGIKVNRKFRLIVGCDEESGWRDVDYIKTKTVFPEYGFSPDGNFPVSYAEKGITEVSFSFPALKRFHSIKGGTVLNAVCDYASAVADADAIDDSLIKKHGLSLKNGNVIESFGKAAHGSTPYLGKNALKPLFEYFLEAGEKVESVIDYLFNDKAGINRIVTPQGAVTLSPDLIEEKNGTVTITCDCRIPAPKTVSDLLPIFDAFNLKFSVKTRHEPVLVEKDGWFVKTLLSSYEKVTGKKEEAISMGGSTFARAFKKGCAFGAQFPNENGNIHDANEYVTEKSLLSAYEIYKTAIFKLAEK